VSVARATELESARERVHGQGRRAAGARIEVTIEIDTEPLPTGRVPDDLAKALAQEPGASTSWQKLAPSVRRGFVKDVIEAKQRQTRVRRIARILATLQKGAPRRRL
jgi:uncharacterized protein YdeI (YjbR/CyaY-like superfamily)